MTKREIYKERKCDFRNKIILTHSSYTISTITQTNTIVMVIISITFSANCEEDDDVSLLMKYSSISSTLSGLEELNISDLKRPII